MFPISFQAILRSYIACFAQTKERGKIRSYVLGFLSSHGRAGDLWGQYWVLHALIIFHKLLCFIEAFIEQIVVASGVHKAVTVAGVRGTVYRPCS